VLKEPDSALPARPDETAEDGGTRIRHILKSPAGDLTHAVFRAGGVSGTHHLPELDEAYFVLGGSGEIWRASDERDAVTALHPGRWVAMPAGTKFQYRSNLGTSLIFLVVVLPSWSLDKFHIVDGGRWNAGLDESVAPTAESDRDDSWMVRDLPEAPDYLAPDGSEIRLLGEFERGGLCHCTLPSGATSSPVRHRTVHELWFVIAGVGEIWRASDGAQGEITPLWPGIGVEISKGTAFQFRNTSAEPLRIAILTMPRWPGASEAEPVSTGAWAPSSNTAQDR
jgi:mannose-6-phosphate isomerase-like protein (cupin superfamily)